MTLTDRDRKILIALVPLLVLVGYWFLLLSPQRKEAARLGDELAKQERRRDKAESRLRQAQAAKDSYNQDYAVVVKLGKAIPSSVDMPSLIVQLDAAAHGTGIKFDKVKTGDRVGAAPQPPGEAGAGAAGATGAGSSTAAAAPGGAAAATGFGSAAEQAGEAKQKAEANAKTGESGAAAESGGSAAHTQKPGVPGLDTVPLEFGFTGDFLELADLLHRLKRFVHVASNGVDVRGRLMTIDGISLKVVRFPRIRAEITATVYLAPKDEGASAGASPQGPGATRQGTTAAGSNAPSQAPAAAATR